MIQVFVPKEHRSGEHRVAATPETVKRMAKEGLAVAVEAGAGTAAHFSDEQYRGAGAEIVTDLAAAWKDADVVLKVGPLGTSPALGGPEVEAVGSSTVLVGLLAPHHNLETVRRLAERSVTSLSMELVPRITRAQSMDVLSSQASIAGYKAVLLGASRLDKYFPLLMTAAGTIKPARVVIMGAGVAGLQAIATAKRLGAIVEVSDIREAVKEQVESLGGRFIELPMQESGEGEGGYAKEMGEEFLRRQREIVKEHVSQADVVITTAQVPGRPAPKLVPADMVEAMRPGAVIVDLAIEQGGNCVLAKADEEVIHAGVCILAPTNLAATLPLDASTLYARNVLALLLLMVKEGELALDPEDEVIAGTLLTHAGEVKHAPTAASLKEVSS